MNQILKFLFSSLLPVCSLGILQAQTLNGVKTIDMTPGRASSFTISLKDAKTEYNAMTFTINVGNGLEINNTKLSDLWKNQYCVTDDDFVQPTDNEIESLDNITLWAKGDMDKDRNIKMSIASTCPLPLRDIDSLLIFNFKADDNIETDLDYYIKLQGVLFEYKKTGKTNINKEVNINIHIYKLGDANRDKKVNVLDGTLVVDHILSRESQDSYNVWLADMNYDNEIDIFDVMQLINKIGEIPPASQATTRAEDNGAFEDLLLKYKEDYAVMSIPNSQRFTSFQFEVKLSEEAELKDARLIGVTTNHIVQYTKIADNYYRIIGISLDNSMLPSDNGGNIIGLEIPNCEKLIIRNAMFVTPQGKATYFNDKELESGVTEDGDESIYDLSGRKMQNNNNKLRKGLYIKKDKKVIVK